jgi:hypothetical protein
MFDSVFPPPIKIGAETFPDEYKPVSVPTLVMFGWDG